jgi:uncharacterized membrane protein (DUF106 family)
MFLPYQELLLWSIGLSFLISVMYRYAVNQNDMRNLKKNMSLTKERMNKAQKEKDLKKSQEYMNEMMGYSQKQMRMSMIPMMLSMVVVLAAFYILLLPLYGAVKVQLPFWLPLFESDFGWLSWYVITGVPATFVFRKLLGVD